MLKPVPIPVFGVPKSVTPNTLAAIRLYWERASGINWTLGEPATKTQVERAIVRSRGMCLPNDILPALDPGDVLLLKEGSFWIDENWNLMPLP